jgi:hypothetical protein
MARRNIWENLWESTEGPSVTLTLPRSVAEELLSMIGAALEVDGMEGGDDELGFDAGPPGGDDVEVPFGDLDDGGELDFGDGEDDMPAGDDSDDEPPPAPKKSPPKKDAEKKADKPKKDDDDSKDKKESLGESVRRLGAYVPRARR